MPPSSTPLHGVKQTDELIIAFCRTSNISDKLVPVLEDAVRLYVELGSDLKLTGEPSDVEVEVMLDDIARPLVEHYQRWFDTFAALMQGDEDAGNYRTKSQHCIRYAMHAFAKSDKPESVKDDVLNKWKELLTRP